MSFRITLVLDACQNPALPERHRNAIRHRTIRWRLTNGHAVLVSLDFQLNIDRQQRINNGRANALAGCVVGDARRQAASPTLNQQRRRSTHRLKRVCSLP